MKKPEIFAQFRDPDTKGKYHMVDISINGYSDYGFNIAMLSDRDQEWITRILKRQFEAAYMQGAKAYKQELADARKAYEDLL